MINLILFIMTKKLKIEQKEVFELYFKNIFFLVLFGYNIV